MSAPPICEPPIIENEPSGGEEPGIFPSSVEELKARLDREDPHPKKMDELRNVFKKYLEIDEADAEILDVVLAAACDRRIGGDPAWLYLIGPSGSFKTEVLRSLGHVPEVYSLDSLTPQTLISGKVEKNRKTGKYEPVAGILQHLDNQVLVIKDFTVVLSMREESRQEILSQLRAAHDGYYEKAFGTLEEPLRIKASFGLVAGVTPALDKYVKTHVSLGERFLKVRVHSDSRKKTARRAVKNLGHEKEMRLIFKRAVGNYLETLEFKIPKVTREQQNKIFNLALYATTMRTHVWAKFYHGEIVDLEPPVVEFPTRIAKQMMKLTNLLAIVRGRHEVTDDDIKTIGRVARDCGSPVRQQIIDYYNKRGLGHEGNVNEIAGAMGLNWKAARAHLEKMAALGIMVGKRKETVRTNEEGNRTYSYGPQTWTLDDTFKGLIRAAGLELTTTGGKGGL